METVARIADTREKAQGTTQGTGDPDPSSEEVRVTNRGSTPVTYRLSDFLLRDQAGTAFDPDPGAAGLASASALPLQGSLQPGASRAGELVFEVPMSDHSATLVWQPSVGAKITVPVTW